MAIDATNGWVYWVHDGINRANLDGTNVEDVVTGILSPRALVLEANDPPEFDFPPTPTDGSAFTVIANDEITILVKASDPDAGQTVTLNAALSPGTGETFAVVTAGNPATSLFSWTPVAANVSPPPTP